MSKTTPTQRTLALLRAEGYTAEVVEKRLPRCFITRDLFGCIDVLAVRPGSPPLGVQCTTRTNQAARLTKAVALPELRTWLASGTVFEVWGWAKVGARGKAKRWQVNRRPVPLADLKESVSKDATASVRQPPEN
jgi:hypothetical protein